MADGDLASPKDLPVSGSCLLPCCRHAYNSLPLSAHIFCPRLLTGRYFSIVLGSEGTNGQAALRRMTAYNLCLQVCTLPWTSTVCRSCHLYLVRKLVLSLLAPEQAKTRRLNRSVISRSPRPQYFQFMTAWMPFRQGLSTPPAGTRSLPGSESGRAKSTKRRTLSRKRSSGSKGCRLTRHMVRQYAIAELLTGLLIRVMRRNQQELWQCRRKLLRGGIPKRLGPRTRLCGQLRQQ